MSVGIGRNADISLNHEADPDKAEQDFRWRCDEILCGTRAASCLSLGQFERVECKHSRHGKHMRQVSSLGQAEQL